MRIIDADEEVTWPPALVAAFTRLERDVRAYHVERRRIDKAAEEDVMLRLKRPPNPYQEAWDDALDVANDTIEGHALLGFHATRLTEREQTNVRQNGLRYLSQDLFESRLSALEADGVLSADRVSQLHSKNQVGDDNRTSMSWFCFSRALLQEEWGISRFFRSWGGEALYNSYEDDPVLGSILRTVGMPCIVAAAVPIAEIKNFLTMGERLLAIWAHRRGISTGHTPAFDGHILMDTPPEKIVRVIRYDAPEFLSLNQHDRWKPPLHKTGGSDE